MPLEADSFLDSFLVPYLLNPNRMFIRAHAKESVETKDSSRNGAVE